VQFVIVLTIMGGDNSRFFSTKGKNN